MPLSEVRNESLRSDYYKKEVIALFQPINKITKTKEGYRMMGQYNNLSYHVFTEEEIEFLCECHYMGKYSLIGGSNSLGENILTARGISERYKIDYQLVQNWLNNYRMKMTTIKEIMDCVNGTILYIRCQQLNFILYIYNSIGKIIDKPSPIQNFNDQRKGKHVNHTLADATINIESKCDDYYEVDRLFRQSQPPGDGSMGPLEGYFKLMCEYKKPEI